MFTYEHFMNYSWYGESSMAVSTAESSDLKLYGSLEETQATDWECVMFPNFNILPLIFHSAGIPMAL